MFQNIHLQFGWMKLFSKSIEFRLVIYIPKQSGFLIHFLNLNSFISINFQSSSINWRKSKVMDISPISFIANFNNCYPILCFPILYGTNISIIQKLWMICNRQLYVMNSLRLSSRVYTEVELTISKCFYCHTCISNPCSLVKYYFLFGGKGLKKLLHDL